MAWALLAMAVVVGVLLAAAGLVPVDLALVLILLSVPFVTSVARILYLRRHPRTEADSLWTRIDRHRARPWLGTRWEVAWTIAFPLILLALLATNEATK